MLGIDDLGPSTHYGFWKQACNSGDWLSDEVGGTSSRPGYFYFNLFKTIIFIAIVIRKYLWVTKVLRVHRESSAPCWWNGESITSRLLRNIRKRTVYVKGWTRQSETEISPFEMVDDRRPVMAQDNKLPLPPERPKPYEVFSEIGRSVSSGEKSVWNYLFCGRLALKAEEKGVQKI